MDFTKLMIYFLFCFIFVCLGFFWGGGGFKHVNINVRRLGVTRKVFGGGSEFAAN